MAKIKITGLDGELKRTKLRIGRAVAKSDFKETLQELTIKEARDKGLRPSLASSTIKSRKSKSKYNTTHPDFKAEKSNLTFTGELLDKVRVKFITSRLTFVYDAIGIHQKYKTKKGKPVKGKRIKNKELLEIQNETRPLLQVFNNESFLREVEKRLRSAILRFFE